MTRASRFAISKALLFGSTSPKGIILLEYVFAICCVLFLQMMLIIDINFGHLMSPRQT